MKTTIPGPIGHPITGSLNAMRTDFLQFLVDTARTYGAVSQFRAGPARMILVNDPEAVGEVLVRSAANFHKTRSTKRLLAPLLGDGLITLEGSEHRRHRLIMQPAFHTRQVAQVGQLVVEFAQRWLDQRHDGELLDIVPAFANLMLDVVIGTFFSTDLGETERVRTALNTFSLALDLRVRSPIPLPRWLPTKHNRILNHALATLDTVVHQLIADRRANPEPPQDLLTMLLTAQDAETGQTLTDQEIRDEIATIFFAGYETTTTTLAWFWYLLTVHPNVRSELRAELMMSVNTDSPAIESIGRLPLLSQTTKEVLRLYPAAWLFDREPVTPTTLAGYEIPAGQTIFISPYLLNRNPEYFDSPGDFRPQRFANDAEKAFPRFAYLPFGAGARICIGQAFAQQTIALVMATLLPAMVFELLPHQIIRPAASATLVPANGIQMRFHRSIS